MCDKKSATSRQCRGTLQTQADQTMNTEEMIPKTLRSLSARLSYSATGRLQTKSSSHSEQETLRFAGVVNK